MKLHEYGCGILVLNNSKVSGRNISTLPLKALFKEEKSTLTFNGCVLCSLDIPSYYEQSKQHFTIRVVLISGFSPLDTWEYPLSIPSHLWENILPVILESIATQNLLKHVNIIALARMALNHIQNN